MKLFCYFLLIVLAGCKNNDDEIIREIAATEDMELKVQQVITQLKNDCDSNLLSAARARADSIRQVRRGEGKKKQAAENSRPAKKL